MRVRWFVHELTLLTASDVNLFGPWGREVGLSGTERKNPDEGRGPISDGSLSRVNKRSSSFTFPAPVQTPLPADC